MPRFGFVPRFRFWFHFFLFFFISFVLFWFGLLEFLLAVLCYLGSIEKVIRKLLSILYEIVLLRTTLDVAIRNMFKE